MSTDIPTSDPRPDMQTVIMDALNDVTCDHESDPDMWMVACRLCESAAVLAALDLPSRDARIRAEVAEEIARELDEWADLERQAWEVSGRTSDLQAGKAGAYVNAARVAREARVESVAEGSAVPAEGSGHPQPSDDEDGRLCTCGCPDSCTCYPEPFDESRVARRMDRWTTGGDTDATR